MEEFFDVNIGLRSRFPLWTNFADYNPNELFEMAVKLVEAKGFKLSKNGYIALKKSFVEIYNNSDAQSGNGRMVRNYVEKLIRNQSIRIVEEDISVYEMNLITAKDVENINVIEDDNIFNLDSRLELLVGNEDAKEFLKNQYKLLKVRERRKKLGLVSDINRYMNIIFTGENGTGKKTVANILSEMYYSMGIVKAKNIVEMDKYEFMAMINKGIKIEDIFSKFSGKMLFLNRVDLLLEEQQYNKIVSDFIKFLDKNNKVILILSGEKEGMKKLVLSNPAFNYRFPTWFDFEDYDYMGLCNIALSILSKKGYSLSKDAEEEINKTIIDIYGNPNLVIKNGLMIKQYLDNLIRTQSIRICDEEFSRDSINFITLDDIINSKKEFLKRNIVK